MCTVFGYSKQAFYKQQKAVCATLVKESVIVGLITSKRKIWKRGSGRNLHKSLKTDFEKKQIKIGRDKFYEVLRCHNLLVKPKRYRTKTTCSYHHFNKYDNLIEGVIPHKANEIWVSDITYLWLKEQDSFCYLSLITDLYSRKIVGHCVYKDLGVTGSLKALEQALKKVNPGDSTIHHSDRGVQYCSKAYVDLLQRNAIQISMTQTGDPKENAVAERINKTIKEEFTEERQINFRNIDQAKTEINKFIQFYNRQRPHRSVEWLTPNEAFIKTSPLKRAWKTYRKSIVIN